MNVKIKKMILVLSVVASFGFADIARAEQWQTKSSGGIVLSNTGNKYFVANSDQAYGDFEYVTAVCTDVALKASSDFEISMKLPGGEDLNRTLKYALATQVETFWLGVATKDYLSKLSVGQNPTIAPGGAAAGVGKVYSKRLKTGISFDAPEGLSEVTADDDDDEEVFIKSLAYIKKGATHYEPAPIVYAGDDKFSLTVKYDATEKKLSYFYGEALVLEDAQTAADWTDDTLLYLLGSYVSEGVDKNAGTAVVTYGQNGNPMEIFSDISIGSGEVVDVPEPFTATLLVAGAGLLLRRRKRA